MLILTRRAGEVLVIGREIRLTMLAVDRDRVEVSIRAPDDVEVHGGGEVCVRVRGVDSPP